jgi:hypothetical protein
MKRCRSRSSTQKQVRAKLDKTQDVVDVVTVKKAGTTTLALGCWYHIPIATPEASNAKPRSARESKTLEDVLQFQSTVLIDPEGGNLQISTVVAIGHDAEDANGRSEFIYLSTHL